MSRYRFNPAWKRAFAALAALAVGVAMAPLASAADSQGTLQVGGVTRTFTVHRPDGAPPRGGFPMILVFHGGGMQAPAMQRLTHMDAVADARGFIAVYPNGIDRHWNDGRSSIRNPQDDVGFISALIGDLEHSSPVDSHRVYATGISNGALFAERLGCDLSSRIAGIAPVAGSMPTTLAPSCHPGRPVAVMQIDGTGDPIMPFNGGAVATFGGRGEGGDVLSVAATTAMWARDNGCRRPAAAITATLPRIAVLDRTTITSTAYTGCEAGGAVRQFTVLGGGHAWPGGVQYLPPAIIGWSSRQMDASRAIADFFLSLPPRT